MEKGEQYTDSPEQILLKYAEFKFGVRFDKNGEQLWWCDDTSSPGQLIVTNGELYFTHTETVVLEIKKAEDGMFIADQPVLRNKTVLEFYNQQRLTWR